MIRPYLEFSKKSFQNNTVYRVEYFAGVINTLIMMFVSISIWKAVLEEEGVLDALQFKMVSTYVVLALLMQLVNSMDDFFIETKVRSGLISSDLLKPISFRLYIFFYNIGSLTFKLLMQLLPTLIVAIVFFKIVSPFSTEMAIYFIISTVLGYLVLYNINFLVWMSSFWFYRTFSLVTIKDAAIMIFSGAILPIWFMPQWLADFIKMTPFESIYYIPITIYLGQVPHEDIISSISRQLMWIFILLISGHVLWKFATKKLVIQGG